LEILGNGFSINDILDQPIPLIRHCIDAKIKREEQKARKREEEQRKTSLSNSTKYKKF